MSEELNNQNATEQAVQANVAENAPVATTENKTEQNKKEICTCCSSEISESNAECNNTETEHEKNTTPQIIVQREYGFAHYVGFALLSVLCICFFFMPGIAITFAINQIPGVALSGVSAWILSCIFSVIAWLIFKLKIKGFKKSFYFYIGLCVAITALLIAIEILTEEINIFANIFAMLTGAIA